MLQDNLRFTLTIIGIFVIAAILLHGLWTIRKSKKNNKKGRASFESHNWEPDFEHEDDLEAEGPIFDDVGVSKARVIINPQSSKSANNTSASSNTVHNKNEFSGNELPVNDERIERAAVKHDGSAGDTSDIKVAPVGIGRAFYEDDDLDKEQMTPFVSTDNSIETEVELSTSNSSDENGKNDEDKHNDSDSSPSNELKVESSANDEDLVTDNDGHVTIDKARADDEDKDKSRASITTRSSDIDSSPVYGNVVTQPKPEFTKTSSKKETLETDFGQPPGFLLKKNQSAEDAAKADEQSPVQPDNIDNNNDVAESNDKTEKYQTHQGQPLAKEVADKSPDFSLNIQEGPVPSAKKQQSPKPEPEAIKPGVEKELSFAEKAKRLVRRSKKTVADNIRKEPVLKNAPSDDQMRIDFETSSGAQSRDESSSSETKESTTNKQNSLFASDEPETSTSQQSSADSQSQSNAQTDVLVLNVRANNDRPIEGAALLPMLLTLGFKFGEHDIFHRHVHSNGKGPILFSLTNMFKPGVFDIDNLENFNTLGISLFMMLPIDADAQQVFNMMHNAARKLADEFDCRILDGNKVGLSKQSLQQYSERIREFERKRSI